LIPDIIITTADKYLVLLVSSDGVLLFTRRVRKVKIHHA